MSSGPDFVKGYEVVTPAYDTTSTGLGVPPTYLGGAKATASTSTSLTSIAVLAVASFPPGAPVDAQLCLVELGTSLDPVGGKKIRWLLSYNASDSTWDFIGGPPLFAEVTTSEQTNSGTYAALSTAGPSIALPSAGDYHVQIGFTQDDANSVVGAMSYDIGGTGAADADATYGSAEAALLVISNSHWREKAGLTAVTLTAKYKSLTGGTNAKFRNRTMLVTPLRLT